MNIIIIIIIIIIVIFIISLFNKTKILNIYRFWLPWLVGMPAETCRAICSMAFGGVFDKLPNLKGKKKKMKKKWEKQRNDDFFFFLKFESV